MLARLDAPQGHQARFIAHAAHQLRTPLAGARTVTVATRGSGERSVLVIADDGQGIPRSEHARISERFRRLDNVSAEGSGLGLAIVSEIAQRHHATIEVADGPRGIGTRVTVS